MRKWKKYSSGGFFSSALAGTAEYIMTNGAVGWVPLLAGFVGAGSLILWDYFFGEREIPSEKTRTDQVELKQLYENVERVHSSIDSLISEIFYFPSGFSRITPLKILEIPEWMEIRIGTILNELEFLGLEVPRNIIEENSVSRRLDAYKYYFFEVGILARDGKIEEARKKSRAICRTLLDRK